MHSVETRMLCSCTLHFRISEREIHANEEQLLIELVSRDKLAINASKMHRIVETRGFETLPYIAYISYIYPIWRCEKYFESGSCKE